MLEKHARLFHNSIRMKAKDWFSDFGRGATLGTGILPGVSVGTVGFIVNVYDKLIDSIDGLRHRKTFRQSFLTLLPIALGCIAAVVLLLFFWSKVANPRFPFVIIAGLAGFVLGALPILTAELKGARLSGPDALRIVLGFALAAGIGIVAYLAAAKIIPIDMNFADEIDTPFQSPWILALVVVVGFVAAVSCLVPGISGSMILFIVGLYNPIVDLFLTRYNPDGSIAHASILRDTSKLGGGVTVILCLLVGIIIGFLAVSKVMKSLLANHRRGTFTVIVGFVLGSVVSMFLNNDMYAAYNNPATNQPWQFILGGVAFLAVGLLTFFLVHKGQRKTLERQETTND